MANITISVTFDIPDADLPYGSGKGTANASDYLANTVIPETKEMLRGSFTGCDRDNATITLTEN
jgi:hypothetical protein